MRFLALELVTIWMTVALITGLAVGALVSSAEKVRHETYLEAIFGRIADERLVR